MITIWQHIAEDNEAAADRLIDGFTQRFELLGNNPEAGRSRDDVREGYRGFPVGNYQIFYRVEDARMITVVHVTHGGRANLG